jgi:methyl-accepting chemotaxis protein
MFNDIKVGVKLIGSIVVVCILAAAVLLYGVKVRSNLLNQMDSVHRQYLADVREIGNIIASLEKMRGDVYRYINVPVERNKMAENINELMKSVNVTMQTYQDRNIVADEAEKKIISDFEAAWSDMQRGYNSIMKSAAEGKSDEVNRLLAGGSDVVEAREKTFASITGLNEYIVSKNEAAVKATSQDTGGISDIMLILSFIGIFLVIGVVIMLTVSITKPLKKGVLMMEELKRGHLSNRLGIKRKDEIGMLANAMDEFAEHLQRNIVSGMQQISEGNINIAPAIIDDKDEIGPALKKMVDTINNLVKEMNFLTKSAMEGKLDVRGNVHDFNGAYQDIVQGVNQTLDAVMGPINEASMTLEKVAGKDMTARVTGDYKGDHAKIKEFLNLAVENLDKALQQVAIGAEQVAAASVQVSTGGQALSQGASEQASSLEEVSSSLQEMSSMTKQNAMNAREANGVAEAARDSSQKGVESMNRMSSAINQIKSSSDATAKIVKTIDEIAFQTNLLALNAAVEAARAGDAGKGFAVVAEEVRNLAMRSAEAAKNTSNLIEEAVKNSENGVTINAEVLKNFHDITDKINKVSQVVAEIAAASEQQDQGISQVNKAVEQLNQLTQQNAANAEESASAAEEMSSQSEEMRSMVAGFKLTANSDQSRMEKSSESRHQNIQEGLVKGQKALLDVTT